MKELPFNALSHRMIKKTSDNMSITQHLLTACDKKHPKEKKTLACGQAPAPILLFSLEKKSSCFYVFPSAAKAQAINQCPVNN